MTQLSSQRSPLARFFLTPDEPRLRAGWRLLAQTAMMVTAIMFFVIPLTLVQWLFPKVDLFLFEPIVTGLAVTISVYLALRFFDRRSFISLGLRWDRQALRDILVGICISAFTMGLVFIIELSTGWLEIQGFGWETAPADILIPNFVFWSLSFLAVGVYEELLSRGYHLQNMEEGLKTPLALFFSSFVFGLGHMGNPEFTWAAALGIAAAGLFMAFAYLRTRQLWLPIGLHIGWNIFEGPIFGFPVSGLETVRLLNHQVNGPTLMTGGAFGPEAGLVVLPAIVIGALMVYWYTRKPYKEKDAKSYGKE